MVGAWWERGGSVVGAWWGRGGDVVGVGGGLWGSMGVKLSQVACLIEWKMLNLYLSFLLCLGFHSWD